MLRHQVRHDGITMKTRRKKTLKPNYQWFKDRIRDCRISQRQLAKQMGIDPSGLNLRLRTGKPPLAPAEIEALARLLNVPASEVLRNAGVQDGQSPRTGKVPVVGWADGDLKVHKGRGKERAEAPPNAPAGLEAIRCQTASTRADSYDGAVMYFVPTVGVPADAIGHLCVVTRPDGSILLRVVRLGYSRGTYNLVDEVGGHVEENAAIDSASRIVWRRM